MESTISKAPDSVVTAKGSLPVQHKIVEHTSTKHKANNQDESHAIKKLKSSHDLSKNTAKQKKIKIKIKIKMIDQRNNKHSQHLMRMMHHPALNGMEKITVVHMMLCLQFYSV